MSSIPSRKLLPRRDDIAFGVTLPVPGQRPLGPPDGDPSSSDNDNGGGVYRQKVKKFSDIDRRSDDQPIKQRRADGQNESR